MVLARFLEDDLCSTHKKHGNLSYMIMQDDISLLERTEGALEHEMIPTSKKGAGEMNLPVKRCSNLPLGAPFWRVTV